jgi:hypothetical protein
MFFLGDGRSGGPYQYFPIAVAPKVNIVVGSTLELGDIHNILEQHWGGTFGLPTTVQVRKNKQSKNEVQF